MIATAALAVRRRRIDAQRVIDTLLSPDFASGWGLRTLAVGEARYNPMSYHNGSVWPHDTAICALGMSRYGERLVVHLFNGLNTAANHGDPAADVPLREETVPIPNVRVRFRGDAPKGLRVEPGALPVQQRREGDDTGVTLPP